MPCTRIQRARAVGSVRRRMSETLDVVRAREPEITVAIFSDHGGLR
jgi:hypothetical protein